MKLVDNWLVVLKRSWVVWASALGAVIPEVLRVVADHSDLIPWFDTGIKSGLQLACLIAIPVLRVVHQPVISGPKQGDDCGDRP